MHLKRPGREKITLIVGDLTSQRTDLSWDLSRGNFATDEPTDKG